MNIERNEQITTRDQTFRTKTSKQTHAQFEDSKPHLPAVVEHRARVLPQCDEVYRRLEAVVVEEVANGKNDDEDEKCTLRYKLSSVPIQWHILITHATIQSQTHLATVWKGRRGPHARLQHSLGVCHYFAKNKAQF